MSKENRRMYQVNNEVVFHIITKQMRLNGNIERTIEDYVKYTLDFKVKTNCKYISEINVLKIYDWFETMEVQNSTRRIRFKSLSAVLTRFYDNGWISNKFWKSI